MRVCAKESDEDDDGINYKPVLRAAPLCCSPGGIGGEKIGAHNESKKVREKVKVEERERD